jgi:hypothetical protein
MKYNLSPREIFIKSFLKRATLLLQEKTNGNTLNKSENELLELGQVIAEIENSIDLFKLFPSLIATHTQSYEMKGFTRVQQHRKNIEWYLNEVYFFKERVTRLLKLIRRKLIKKNFSKTSIEIQLIDRLINNLISSTKNLIEIRNDHVHHFSYQDKDLHHIELLDVAYRTLDLSPLDKKHIYADLKFDLYIQRKKWKEIIKNNTSNFLKLLDCIYLALAENELINKAT